jgi:hypothetical protein
MIDIVRPRRVRNCFWHKTLIIQRLAKIYVN